MGTELGYNITPRNFCLRLRDGREINITKSQKEAVTSWINDKTPFIEIFDCDNGDLLYAGKTQNIEEIKERQFKKSGYIAICAFGERHQLIEGKIDCDCSRKMGILDYDVITALNMIGYKVHYSVDITKEMRQELYKYIKANSDFKEKLSKYFESLKAKVV